MCKIQEELKESKENVSKLQKDNEEIRKYITKKNHEFPNIQSLNESLIKDVKNLNQEKSSKAKWEKDDSREDLKKKDEEIYRLQKHNKTLLDEVKRCKEENKNYQNQEEIGILDEESTKRMEEGICKNIEESLNTNEVE
jgi:chromosome segregation ATPase